MVDYKYQHWFVDFLTKCSTRNQPVWYTEARWGDRKCLLCKDCFIFSWNAISNSDGQISNLSFKLYINASLVENCQSLNYFYLAYQLLIWKKKLSVSFFTEWIIRFFSLWLRRKTDLRSKTHEGVPGMIAEMLIDPND